MSNSVCLHSKALDVLRTNQCTVLGFLPLTYKTPALGYQVFDCDEKTQLLFVYAAHRKDSSCSRVVFKAEYATESAYVSYCT